MTVRIEFTSDWHRVNELAREFLEASALLNALPLTLLDARLRFPQPVHCWIAQDRGQIIGLVLQSPFSSYAEITKVNRRIARMIVHEIHRSGVALPGVIGDAGSAASFAAEWAEVTKTPVVVRRSSRLYEIRRVREPREPRGRFRPATVDDSALVAGWATQFLLEVGEDAPEDMAGTVARGLEARRIWLWDCDGPVSMCVASVPAGGVVLITAVYTPAVHRNFGYAGACVASQSRHILSQNNRCALYADLANPISNALYRRLGYEPIAEALLYAFNSQ